MQQLTNGNLTVVKSEEGTVELLHLFGYPKCFYISSKNSISEAIEAIKCPVAREKARSLSADLKFVKNVNMLFKDRSYQVFSNMELVGTKNSILIVERGKATSFCTRHPIVGVYDDKFNREAVDVYSLLPKLLELGFEVQSRWSRPYSC